MGFRTQTGARVQRRLGRRLLGRVWILGVVLSISLSAAEELPQPVIEEPTVEVPIPAAIPDPLEPLNRALGIVNHGVMKGVIQPTSYIYRLAVRRPIRAGIVRIHRNLGFPGRLINNLLQAKWHGAQNETERFVLNSTLGVGGFFDVATRFGIAPSNEDFGQTFGTWGWRPQFYLFAPLLGPTNDRDAVGAVGDSLANPANYISPLPWIFGYNRLAHEIHRYNAFVVSEQDPYNISREVWAWQRAAAVRPPVHQSEDTPATQTLKAVLFQPNDPEFGVRARESTVELSRTGRTLPYSVWMQPQPAPIVYLLPAIGDHRRGAGVSMFAEELYGAGYSVVAISSIFNHEFIERWASVAVPGYSHLDVQDVYAALNQIHAELQGRYGTRLKRPILLGLSMGGYHALTLAAHPEFQTGRLQFERFIALHAPVSLGHALLQMDRYYNAPLAWLEPAGLNPIAVGPDSMVSDRALTQRLRETFMKAVRLADESLTRNDPMPFTDIEAKYLIGVRSRVVIRDTIYVSQAKRDFGVLETPIRFWSRRSVYDEIQQYSLAEYLNRFVLPYYESIFSPSIPRREILAAADLKNTGEKLKGMPNVFIVANENDFLLSDSDIRWLRSVIPPSRRVLFPSGGHMGNILAPAVRQAILSALRE